MVVEGTFTQCYSVYPFEVTILTELKIAAIFKSVHSIFGLTLAMSLQKQFYNQTQLNLWAGGRGGGGGGGGLVIKHREAVPYLIFWQFW